MIYIFNGRLQENIPLKLKFMLIIRITTEYTNLLKITDINIMFIVWKSVKQYAFKHNHFVDYHINIII